MCLVKKLLMTLLTLFLSRYSEKGVFFFLLKRTLQLRVIFFCFLTKNNVTRIFPTDFFRLYFVIVQIYCKICSNFEYFSYYIIFYHGYTDN